MKITEFEIHFLLMGFYTPLKLKSEQINMDNKKITVLKWKKNIKCRKLLVWIKTAEEQYGSVYAILD